jgi:uncharacterized protein (TIGR03083 family)
VAGNQWPLIRAERVALIADLETLTDAQWSTPSLCAGWTVRDVLAHMTMTAKMTPGRFVGKLASSGFRFNAMTAKGTGSHSRGHAGGIQSATRSHHGTARSA